MSIPNLKIVYRVTHSARAKWRFVLTELDVTKDTIDAIAEKWRDNPDECLYQGLSEWLNGGERSWRDVVDALSSPPVGHRDLANRIEKEFLKPNDDDLRRHAQDEQQHSTTTSFQTIKDDLLIYTHKLLGNGASGTVFEGLYRDSPCAVKVLNHIALSMQTSLPSGPGLDEAVRRFDRECEFLKTIVHDNVVRHLTTARHPQSGNNILVTELMDCNLSTYLSKSVGSLATNGEICISKDISMGLAYIHSRNIVHRDLCSHNILLTSLTQPIPIAKISDFGLSRLLDPSAMTHTLTALHHRDGYMPPEAARETGEQYNESIDVFSLGVIILQIACRADNVPSAKNRDSLFLKMTQSHPLMDIVTACTAKFARRRPSAKEVGSKLSCALQSGGAVSSSFVNNEIGMAASS